MRPLLEQRIQESASLEGEVRVISLEQARALARTFDLPLRQVEIATLELQILPRRYLRNLGTVGWEGQHRLLQSHVAIAGLGGLGGHAAEALARMGVGRLTLIDGDRFVEHNLNRQLFGTEASLGVSKVEAARDRLALVNAATEVVTHCYQAGAEDLPRLLEGAQVVVDGLDRIPSRLILQDAAQALRIPFVHGAIAGMFGQVTTILPGDEGLRALYGSGEMPEQGIEMEQGCPAATPMAVAAWQVQEVIKLLLGLGRPLHRRMLLMDFEAGVIQSVNLGRPTGRK